MSEYGSRHEERVGAPADSSCAGKVEVSPSVKVANRSGPKPTLQRAGRCGSGRRAARMPSSRERKGGVWGVYG